MLHRRDNGTFLPFPIAPHIFMWPVSCPIGAISLQPFRPARKLIARPTGAKIANKTVVPSYFSDSGTSTLPPNSEYFKISASKAMLLSRMQEKVGGGLIDDLNDHDETDDERNIKKVNNRSSINRDKQSIRIAKFVPLWAFSNDPNRWRMSVNAFAACLTWCFCYRSRQQLNFKVFLVLTPTVYVDR